MFGCVGGLRTRKRRGRSAGRAHPVGVRPVRISGHPTYPQAPLFIRTKDSPEYFGTMIADPGVKTVLPVFYWWAADTRAAKSRKGTRCSVYHLGEFYDNVRKTSAGRLGRA